MQNQFVTIQPWLPDVLAAIKREIRTDHLANSPSFVRAHFGNRPLNRLTFEEILAVYEKNLLSGDEDLAEWVVNRWVFKHGDLYAHFAERLEKIDANYHELEHLSEEQSEQVLEGAVARFGAVSTYLFSVLNHVVFPKTVFDRLRSDAEKEESAKKVEIEERNEAERAADLKVRHEKEMARIQEKFESKISGIMKKYTVDIEALKKQIRALQKQISSR